MKEVSRKTESSSLLDFRVKLEKGRICYRFPLCSRNEKLTGSVLSPMCPRLCQICMSNQLTDVSRGLHLRFLCLNTAPCPQSPAQLRGIHGTAD